MSNVVLETRGLTREFNGFTAMDSVYLQMRQGHIHALIGANGAGKSTLFNLLTRFLPATRGEVLSQGKAIGKLTPKQIARQGLVRSLQTFVRVRPPERAGKRARGLRRPPGTLFAVAHPRPTQRTHHATARAGRPAGLRHPPSLRRAGYCPGRWIGCTDN